MTDQPILDSAKVNQVLLFIQDLFDRSQMPLLALKDTGKQIKETQDGLIPDLHLKVIELGIQKKDLSQSGTSMLKGLLKLEHVEFKWDDNVIMFTRNDVPVFIKIINRKYGFLQNVSKVYYRTVEFDIPNPFNIYWTTRHLIR